MKCYRTRLPSHCLPTDMGSEKIIHKIYPCEISERDWDNAEKLNGQSLNPGDKIFLKHQGRDYEISVLKTY